MDKVGHEGEIHTVNRDSINNSVFDVYKSNIDNEYTVYFKYENEVGVDSGGVTRDVIGAFWEEVFSKFFDGVTCVIPASKPGIEMDLFHVMGRIVSHDYVVTGFLAVRISFPCLCTMLLGTNVTIPNQLLIISFIDFLNNRESTIIETALNSEHFSSSLISKLSDVLGSFNCFQVDNLRSLLCQVAKCELLQKPLAFLLAIHAGVTAEHAEFWKQKDVDQVYKLYCSMSYTAEKVISLIHAQQRNSVLCVIFSNMLVI